MTVQEAEIRQEYEVPLCTAHQGDHQQHLYTVHLKMLGEKDSECFATGSRQWEMTQPTVIFQLQRETYKVFFQSNFTISHFGFPPVLYV